MDIYEMFEHLNIMWDNHLNINEVYYPYINTPHHLYTIVSYHPCINEVYHTVEDRATLCHGVKI